MPTKKKIIDAKDDSEGDITHVRFRGNQNFTPVEQAMKMADRDKIENAHTVRRRNAKPHLRTNPDRKKNNNLDYWADDD